MWRPVAMSLNPSPTLQCPVPTDGRDLLLGGGAGLTIRFRFWKNPAGQLEERWAARWGRPIWKPCGRKPAQASGPAGELG